MYSDAMPKARPDCECRFKQLCGIRGPHYRSTLDLTLDRLDAREVRIGINWIWAYFRSEADAYAYLVQLDSLGYEHRGVYAPITSPDTLTVDGLWGVRWR